VTAKRQFKQGSKSESLISHALLIVGSTFVENGDKPWEEGKLTKRRSISKLVNFANWMKNWCLG